MRSFGPTVPRLLRGLRHPVSAHRARARLVGRRATARRLVEQLATHDHIPLSARRLEIGATFLTEGEVLIARVSSGTECAVLKLAATDMVEQSFARHREATGRIHASPALLAVQPLVPRTIAWGQFEDCSYQLETAIPGEAVGRQLQAAELSSLVRFAADALLTLQVNTRQQCIVDEPLFERLAGRHLSGIRTTAMARPNSADLCEYIDRTESELRELLLSLELPVTWIHGDYWPGNLLFCRNGAVRLSGIVDWDRASSSDLPLHDLLHLIAYSRKLHQPGSLGYHIESGLLPGAYMADELRLLEESCRQLGVELTSDLLRGMTIIYWARFVAEHLARYPGSAANRHWFDENVSRVLHAIVS